MSLKRRLAQIVAQIDAQAAPAEDAAADGRWVGLCAELTATMDPSHVARVNAVWAARAAGEPVCDEGAARLAQVAESLLSSAYHGIGDGALALPPAVAQVYLDVGGNPFDRCVACRLSLPSAAEHWRGGPGGGQHVPAWHPFKACPDCGGAVASHANGRARPAAGLVSAAGGSNGAP